MKALGLSLVDVELISVGGLLKLLSEVYAAQIGHQSSDFAIHSFVGQDVLKHGAVRPAWLGENLQPNFSASGYALGFGRSAYADRYRRVSLKRPNARLRH